MSFSGSLKQSLGEWILPTSSYVVIDLLSYSAWTSSERTEHQARAKSTSYEQNDSLTNFCKKFFIELRGSQREQRKSTYRQGAWEWLDGRHTVVELFFTFRRLIENKIKVYSTNP